MAEESNKAEQDNPLQYPRYRWNDVWAEYSPEKFRLYQTWMSEMLTHRELTPKVRELIILAIDAVVAWPGPYIDGHVEAALNAGASPREIVEAFEVTGYLMGVHPLNHGLSALDRVLQKREEERDDRSPTTA